MKVSKVALRNFRNYERLELMLPADVTVVLGEVAAGKTNLLEGLYFGCVGRSCRTSNEIEVVRFGEDSARVAITGSSRERQRTFEVGLERGRQKVVKVDGVNGLPAGSEGTRPLVCVFMPDRLDLVKGPAGRRRAHLDTFVAAAWPGRRETRRSYARALAQRNILLAKTRRTGETADALRSWTRELARHGAELMRDRADAVRLLEGAFAEHARALGLGGDAELRYVPATPASTAQELQRGLGEHLERDIERGFTTHGPHRDDLALELASRLLRRFGSQGQQRLALLSLLLAERDALAGICGEVPVLLLDDVLSELDHERRKRLFEVLAQGGQTLITTADPFAASAANGSFATLRVADGRVES